MTTLRMLLAGVIFAQTIRWAWAWWRARRPETVGGSTERFTWNQGAIAAALADLLAIGTGRLVRPAYGALPWDPTAQLRVRPLSSAERSGALALELALARGDDRRALLD